MAPSLLRTILGTLAGTGIAFALVLLFQYAGNLIAPDVFVPETGEILISLPSTLGLLLGWFVGTFAGAWLAMRISGGAAAGWIAAGTVIGAALYRAGTLDDAWWVFALGLLIPVGAAFVAQRTAQVTA